MSTTAACTASARDSRACGTAEAVAASFGEPALAIAHPSMALQRLLGDQHDAVVAHAMLTQAGQVRDVDPHDASALARLESQHAVAAEKAYFRLAAREPVPAPASVLPGK